jgi:hypothetical protein
MSLSHSPSIVRDGLYFYFDPPNSKSFWQDAGTSYGQDLSGNNVPVSFVNNPNNQNLQKSLSFDGINQELLISSGLFISPTLNWTASIWFKMNQMPTSTVSANAKVFGGSIGDHWCMCLSPVVSGSTAKINMRCDDSGETNTTNYIISGNEWVNFVAVGVPYNDGAFNRGKVTLYVNGALDTPETIVGDTNGWSTRNPNTVGYDHRRLVYSNLEIGSIATYNRLLSSTEIKQNFNALRGRYGI